MVRLMRWSEDKKKQLRLRVLFSYLRNPFPTEDYNYMDSVWYQWIKRIREGQKLELAYLSKRAKNMRPENVGDYLAEDLTLSQKVSENMYAALIVAMWSEIESFFRSTIEVCIASGESRFGGSYHKIFDVAKYFKDNIDLSLNDLPDSDIVNSVRVMSNSFKHNQDRYHPDRFPIKKELIEKYKIEEERKINYAELPIEEILCGCGKFCDALEKIIKNKIRI